MGLDGHGLNFLRYARKNREFENVITIGRQGLGVSEDRLRKMFQLRSDYKTHEYCEQVLRDYLGASKVDSVDCSNYENASIVHDMNQPLPPSFQSKYETVIDMGTLEHIYNIPQALKNCSQLCKPGGQIIHILPANNFCGHGFWQVSPELFFSLYSHGNGYKDTEVFMALLQNIKKWYRVKPPQNGRRIVIYSGDEVYVMVRTVLESDHFQHNHVQQSDYLFHWANAGKTVPGGTFEAIKKMLTRFNALHRFLSHRIRRLSKLNSDLVEVNVEAFLRSSRN
jgi:Methyltransferase domain